MQIHSQVLLVLAIFLGLPQCVSSPSRLTGYCKFADDNGFHCGFVRRGQAQLYFETTGEGTALVLVHGGANHGIFHDGLIDLASDCTLVYYDQRGYGHTRVGFGGDSPATLATEVADLDALRRHLGFERIDLLALSNGGPIAIDYTLAHPERVRRLILLDTYADNDDRISMAQPLVAEAINDEGRQTALQKIRADETLDELQRKVEEFLLLPHTHHHSPVPRSLVETWYATGVLDRNIPKDQRRFQSTPERDYSRLGDLTRIHCPTLVICGRHDRVTPLPHSQKMAAQLPRGELAILELSGHLGHIEERDRFLNLVRQFLAGRNDS
jgi:proline iminopeptidase